MKIVAIPAFSNNYIWAIHSQNNKRVTLVDPGDGELAEKYIKENNLRLDAILLTHGHFDHAGGVNYLLSKFNTKVYGSRVSDLEFITHAVADADRIIASEYTFEVIAMKGHTQDHIAFYHEKNCEYLFSGDVIFSAGCGRIIDGDPCQMYVSLSKIKRLPKTTFIYPAHEYSIANLEFASELEPFNKVIKETKEKYLELIKSGLPTLPTTVGLEMKINPFLRTENKELLAKLNSLTNSQVNGGLEAFKQLRKLKDQY